MTAHRGLVAGFVVVLSLAVVVGSVAFVPGGVVTANHEPEDADYAVEPMSDRSPGATNVRYGQIVVAEAGVDLETLEEMKAVYEEGSWSGCGPDDGETFGIDRGNTHDGYGTDESLEENVKSFSAGEDVFKVEFYGEDDFGSSTYLDNGDAIVSVAQCIDNPDDPGWYQISGSTTGVTEDGERRTFSTESHYFWVCDCEDEEEAREKLGPPPSEPQETATPEPDESEGSDSGSDSDTDAGESGDGEADGDGDGEGDSAESTAEEDASTMEETTTPEPEGETTPERTEATGSGDSDESGETGGGSEQAQTPADAEWDSHVVQTPTPGDGDGFGPVVAIGALAAVGLLALRRR